MDALFAIAGGLGGIFWLITMALIVLTPIMVYLIQRNTYQNRQELRKLNKNVEALHYLLGKQTGLLKNNQEEAHEEKTNKPQKNKMTCPECKEKFQYPPQYKGQYKPCPICHKKIFLD